MLKKLPKPDFSDWISNFTDSHISNEDGTGEAHVGCCVPKVFPSYCKILHSIYEDLSIVNRSVTWNDLKAPPSHPSDPVAKLRQESTFVCGGDYDACNYRRIRWETLAKERNLIFHPEINVDSFTRNFPGKSWPRYLIGPEEGVLELETCKEIVKILIPYTGSQTCYFFYDLIATDDYASDLLFEGTILDVFETSNVENVHSSPTRWWPDDRSWFVHTDYDLTFTLVGGQPEVINALLANPELESIEVRPDHRVDYRADRINP